jgi:hypothetical protein
MAVIMESLKAASNGSISKPRYGRQSEIVTGRWIVPNLLNWRRYGPGRIVGCCRDQSSLTGCVHYNSSGALGDPWSTRAAQNERHLQISHSGTDSANQDSISRCTTSRLSGTSIINGSILSRTVIRRTSQAAVIALLLLGTTDAFAEDQDFSFTGNFGLDYSNGDYGTAENTGVLVALTSLGVQTDDFHFYVSLPHLDVSGQGLILFDASGNPIVASQGTGTSFNDRSGFGDVSVSAAYDLPPAILDDFQLELIGRVKIPTASQSKGLSTGKADFGASIDLSRDFGIWGPFITLSFLKVGQPSAYSLDNTYSVSAGTSVELNSNLIAIASYDYDSPITPLVDASNDLFGSLTWIYNDTITLTGYGTTGLSSGAPAISAGFFVSYKFN